MLERIRPRPIPRTPGTGNRLVAVALAARFADELLYGLPDVLMPTIRSALGLSLTQVGVLDLVLATVAGIVEPVADLLIDVWRRRWLMALGAAGIAAAVVVMGGAATFGALALGFAVYGLASGPLAHTADVVLVDAHPDAPERAMARSTVVDTVGALLAPGLVVLAAWFGLGWRPLLVGAGVAALAYAAAVARTPFPGRAGGHGRAPDDGGPLWHQARANLAAVLADGAARRWLAFLFLLQAIEAPARFKTVWLAEQAGLSQGLVGTYRILELAVGLVALLALDRLLARWDARRLLQAVNVASLVLYPIWLLVPGIPARFALAVPLGFATAIYWPVGRARALASLPGRGGSVTAVSSLLGLVPLPLAVGWLADRLALTPVMLVVHVAATLAMVVLVGQLPEGRQRSGSSDRR